MNLPKFEVSRRRCSAKRRRRPRLRGCCRVCDVSQWSRCSKEAAYVCAASSIFRSFLLSWHCLWGTKEGSEIFLDIYFFLSFRVLTFFLEFSSTGSRFDFWNQETKQKQSKSCAGVLRSGCQTCLECAGGLRHGKLATQKHLRSHIANVNDNCIPSLCGSVCSYSGI